MEPASSTSATRARSRGSTISTSSSSPATTSASRTRTTSRTRSSSSRRSSSQSKKHVARMFWSSETDMQNAFASGRPLDRVCVARRLGGDEGEEAAGRLHAPEGRRALLDRDADARQGLEAPRARARVRELVELEAGRRRWLENNYAYGHANTLAGRRRGPADGAAADEPARAAASRTRTSTATSRGGASTRRLWEEVKAS